MHKVSKKEKELARIGDTFFAYILAICKTVYTNSSILVSTVTCEHTRFNTKFNVINDICLIITSRQC